DSPCTTTGGGQVHPAAFQRGRVEAEIPPGGIVRRRRSLSVGYRVFLAPPLGYLDPLREVLQPHDQLRQRSRSKRIGLHCAERRDRRIQIVKTLPSALPFFATPHTLPQRRPRSDRRRSDRRHPLIVS